MFDERKNLVPAKSFGHVNHPANVGSGWRWATLVDRLLEASVYGLRQPLEIGFDVYSYASPDTVMKPKSLDPVPISVVKNATQPEPKCVDAQMQDLTTTVFEQSIWCGERGDRMRLLITLRDDSAMLPVILWSTEFLNIINHNCDELALLYAACENGEDEKKEFLEASNENANEPRREVLRPREWSRSDGSKVLQWTVAGVNTPP